jgi:hypothetical protein
VITLSLQYTHTSNHALLHVLLLNEPLFRSLPRIPLPLNPERRAARTASDADSDGHGAEGDGAADGGTADGEGAAGGAFAGLTAEWLEAWQAKLPLRSIFAALDALMPRTSRDALLQGPYPETLKAVSLVGVLPPPAPIAVRRYAPGESSRVWLTQVIWGLVYARNQELFDARMVKLVQILQLVDGEQG